MIDHSSRPTTGAAPALVALRPARECLPNGLDVVWLRRSRLPEASLRLVLPAGADVAGPETAGIASLVAKLLPEGAAGRGAREMAEWIEGLGINLRVSVSYDAAVIHVHTLSDVLAEALDVLAAVAREPEFVPEEVERCRLQRLDAIRRMRDEPTEVSKDLLAELVYDDHPYGRLPRGRAGTVESLAVEDLMAFHRSRYAPAVATMVACGDLPAEGFKGMVADRFGSWGGEAPATTPPPAPEAPAAAGVVLVDRPGSRQSVIQIAGIGLARGDAGEPAARVMNAILGGLFNSRLNLNLREDKGWTYGARSVLTLRRSAGPLTIRAAVETGVTADAVSEMWSEIRHMGARAPERDEMRMAAGALTRSLPLKFETTGQVAGSLVEQAVYGLDDDYWPRFAEAIETVSAPEVQAEAVRRLDPSQLVTLVVGDAEAVGPSLEALGPVQVRIAP
jgi:zinc protease